MADDKESAQTSWGSPILGQEAWGPGTTQLSGSTLEHVESGVLSVLPCTQDGF